MSNYGENHWGDSKHVVVKDVELKDGGVLHRFENRAGVPYSAIYVGDMEMGSCERDREQGMVDWWNGR